MRTYTTATLVFALASASLHAGPMHRASFPGEPAVLASPDGRHAVKWVAPAYEGDSHHLFLSDVASWWELELLAFPRGVDVLWSRSGNHLAVGNHWASDEATVLLWESLAAAPRDLLDELLAYEHQTVARWNAHHIYLEVEGWQGDDVLAVRVWGYGNPEQPGLDKRYRYIVGRGFAKK